MTTLANRVKPWALDLRSRPLLDYVVILGVVFILSGLGIVMVFSSSMAVSALQDDSPWSRVVRQGVMVVVGFIMTFFVYGLVAAGRRGCWWRRLPC